MHVLIGLQLGNEGDSGLVRAGRRMPFHPVVRCFHLAFFFFNATATTEIYTLSLHDALPIFRMNAMFTRVTNKAGDTTTYPITVEDRKSTRLNSSHRTISYAVFCLKKKK